jgi:soluble lytic murein transglycosylase-like protein
MPMRWTTSAGRLLTVAKRAGARYGVKAAIVVSGAAVAISTVNRTTFVQETPLAQRVVALTPAPRIVAEAVTLADSSVVASSSLDNGADHGLIDKWIGRLSVGVGFKQSLVRMSKYSDMITTKLEKKEMPKDLIYLALIESNFNPNAKSPVKAVGMWQFMSATARQFGLKVRGKVDERKNPARATDAALAYLEQLHDRFGSWYLAAAAYNSGQGTVSRALKRVTGKTTGTDEDFFRILKVLPKETQDYVPKLIAASRIGRDPQRYGIALAE